MAKRMQIVAITTALAAGFCIGLMGTNGSADGHRMQWVDGEFPEEFANSMEESAAAFQRKDIEATRAYMADDFATFELHGKDAPKLLVGGREATIEVMNKFFASDFGSRWDGAEVERLGSIGNTMVQIEHDRYKYDDGIRTISTFVIIQYKGGKRWREWRLRPDPA